MKKFITLIAAVLMSSASAETLDLYDGDDWSFLVPINSWGYDMVGSRSQILYPADDLTPMVGQKITAITRSHHLQVMDISS